MNVYYETTCILEKCSNNRYRYIGFLYGKPTLWRKFVFSLLNLQISDMQISSEELAEEEMIINEPNSSDRLN